MLSSQFYRCSSGILEISFADIESLFYAVVGEITSMPPSTGEEFGSIAIACIMDAFRRLRYMISEGFLVMC